jgi:hypothetical protein
MTKISRKDIIVTSKHTGAKIRDVQNLTEDARDGVPARSSTDISVCLERTPVLIDVKAQA